MSCGCEHYFNKNFEECFKCTELCHSGGKDCARLCPCHNIMQEMYRNTSNLLRQNSLLQTQIGGKTRENDLLFAWVITLACVLFALLVICAAAAYWYYRRYCNKANVLKGQPKQAEDNDAKEKQVIVGVSTPNINGVSANGTAEGRGEEDARQTLLKTSCNDDGDDSRQTEVTLIMPEQ